MEFLLASWLIVVISWSLLIGTKVTLLVTIQINRFICVIVSLHPIKANQLKDWDAKLKGLPPVEMAASCRRVNVIINSSRSFIVEEFFFILLNTDEP